MAYRIPIKVRVGSLEGINRLQRQADRLVQPILTDTLNETKQWYVQNLSGVPFQSQTGTHVINKRSGRAAASIQIQVPYGSPYRGRLFANAQTRYDGNPESYNYLQILEKGRGEVRPRYTPAALRGDLDKARIVIPADDGEQLVFNQNGFRGVTGRYIFLKKLPPVEGKYPLKAAVDKASEVIPEITGRYISKLLKGELS